MLRFDKGVSDNSLNQSESGDIGSFAARKLKYNNKKLERGRETVVESNDEFASVEWMKS